MTVKKVQNEQPEQESHTTGTFFFLFHAAKIIKKNEILIQVYAFFTSPYIIGGIFL